VSYKIGVKGQRTDGHWTVRWTTWKHYASAACWQRRHENVFVLGFRAMETSVNKHG